MSCPGPLAQGAAELGVSPDLSGFKASAGHSCTMRPGFQGLQLLPNSKWGPLPATTL